MIINMRLDSSEMARLKKAIRENDLYEIESLRQDARAMIDAVMDDYEKKIREDMELNLIVNTRVLFEKS